MIETVALNRAKQAYLDMLVAEKEELEEAFERLKDQLGVTGKLVFQEGILHRHLQIREMRKGLEG